MAEIYIHISLQGHIQTNLGPLFPPAINSPPTVLAWFSQAKTRRVVRGGLSPHHSSLWPGKAPESVIPDGDNHRPSSPSILALFQEAFILNRRKSSFPPRSLAENHFTHPTCAGNFLFPIPLAQKVCHQHSLGVYTSSSENPWNMGFCSFAVCIPSNSTPNPLLL